MEFEFKINDDLSASRDMMDFDLDMSDVEYNEEDCLEEFRSDLEIVKFFNSLTDKKIDDLSREIKLDVKELRELLCDKLSKIKNEITITVQNITAKDLKNQEVENEFNLTEEKLKTIEQNIVKVEGQLNKNMDIVIKAKKEKDIKIDAIKQAKNDLENKIELYEELLGLSVKQEQPTSDVFSIFFDKSQGSKSYIKVRMRQKKNNDFDWDLLDIGEFPDSFEELAHRLRQTGNILETIVYVKDYYNSVSV